MGYTAFELAWMEKLASANSEMTIADLSEGIELISENEEDHGKDFESDHHHHGIDPHIWLSPMNVKGICENIYEALAEMYPEHEDEFSSNLIIFEGKLDSLDRFIKASLEDLDSRSFFTYHPALSYFARDYNLEQYPIELGGKEPSPAHLKKLVDLGKQNRISLIFLQMQFDQRNAEVLANEIDAEIVQINPLDIEWFEQMILITNKLKSNLN
jgi:zinc transport system substrate-binding protein